MDDEARSQIDRGLPAGPLSGAPYLLKDLYQPYTGVAVSNGSRLFDGFVADHDGTLTERLKAAGVVIVGRSNTPEFGLACTTEPVRFGPTRNPWNLGHSAGGSSGGAVGGGGRRHGAGRPCHRWRRLDPHSGRPLRPVRPEAHARAQSRRPRCGRGVERACRAAMR